MLHGRAHELAVIAELLERASRGSSGALILRGEPGIGKSSLLSHAAEHSAGMQVLRVVGVPSEVGLAFAALHQLLWPVREDIERLPAPQAAALGEALGLGSAAIGERNRFLVSAGALTLLADIAERRPVLCLVDDAHWLDESSADVLLFVARRIEAEGIALVFAARDGEGNPLLASTVPELRLAGLDVDASYELLAEGAADLFERSVVGDLVGRTGGNPLALLEAASSLGPDERAGRKPLPAATPIGPQLERTFLDRVEGLPAATQTLLQILAAEGSGALATVLAVAAGFDVGIDALGSAEAAGLLRVHDGQVTYCHPLMRAAVYGAMTFERRRAIHQTLAESLGAAAADRQAWHLAAAASGPDEVAAAALESSADRARARSGHAAAAAALERAAALSTDERAGARRLVLAAESAWSAGQTTQAQALVDRAQATSYGRREGVLIANLQGLLHLRTGTPAEAIDILVHGAEMAADDDPMLALEMLMAAVDAANNAGEPLRIVDIGRRAEALRAPDSDRARFALRFLGGTSALMEGDTARGMDLLEAADALAEALDEPALLRRAALAGLYRGRGDNKRLAARALARSRTLAAVGDLPSILVFTSLEAAAAGFLSQAIVHASEGLHLARETGQETAACCLLAALATVAGLRGREQECRAYAQEAFDHAVPRRLGLATGFATEALALLDLGLGRPEQALERYLSIVSAAPGAGHPFVAYTTTSFLVESAVRAGQRGVAEAAVSRFATGAERAGAGHRAMLAYCRGLLGDDDPSAHFEEALALFDAPLPFWRARVELGFGEHLRRTRQRTRARSHLRSALGSFDALGIAPWAERARSELRASGETARLRTPDTRTQLTPRELQIAGFASQGVSNPDIAAQLFLSRRTVEYHLRKVYQKLDITSRAQLAELGLPH